MQWRLPYFIRQIKSTPANLHIYCNQEIVTEIFLPSLGHFIVGNYWLGIFRLSLILTYLLSSYILYKKVVLPPLFTKLIRYIGFYIEDRMRCRRETQIILCIWKIFSISSTLASLMYFVDLIFYKFGIYTDGNGVPFV